VYIATETSPSSSSSFAFPYGFFPENMGVVSDELGEVFHPGISQIEKR